MLPKQMRLTKPAEFTAVLKSGRRVSTKYFAVHVLSAGSPAPDTDGALQPDHPLSAGRPARSGFVVSSKVGNSVVRHRVTRRLREQVRPLLMVLGPETDVVVRAFPAAAGASSAQIAADLRAALTRAGRRPHGAVRNRPL